MGLQVRCHGLRWWWARRDWLRSVCPGVLPGPRQAPGANDGQLPSSQRVSDCTWYHVPLVRMARIQRWLIFWRQFASRAGLLEHQLDGHVRCRILDDPRLETGPKVVDGRLVFRCHFWPRRSHARLGILHGLGLCHPWHRRRCVVQLRHQTQVQASYRRRDGHLRRARPRRYHRPTRERTLRRNLHHRPRWRQHRYHHRRLDRPSLAPNVRPDRLHLRHRGVVLYNLPPARLRHQSHPRSSPPRIRGGGIDRHGRRSIRGVCL